MKEKRSLCGKENPVSLDFISLMVETWKVNIVKGWLEIKSLSFLKISADLNLLLSLLVR